MSSDFCVRCDNALSVYCGKCMDGVRDERDALHRALRETLAALGNGSAATSEASVAFMANTPNEVRAVVDDLRRERDDYKTKLDAELPAAWREDLESLNRITEAALQRCDELRSLADSAAHEQGIAQRRMMQAQKSRDEARAELAFIDLQYAAANESDLTRDALCLQIASLRALIREAHRELSTIEAITVSPSDTDGLIQLCKRLAAAGKLGAKTESTT